MTKVNTAENTTISTNNETVELAKSEKPAANIPPRIRISIQNGNKNFERVKERLANLNLKEGGKASDIFVSQKGILPLEVINCFIDADETGETKLYIEKALDYCESKDSEINETIKEWGPTIINVVIYMVVGLLVVALVKDIMQNGILDVMTRM